MRNRDFAIAAVLMAVAFAAGYVSEHWMEYISLIVGIAVILCVAVTA